MTKHVPYIIIAVLLVSLFVSLTNRKEVVIEKTISDTVYITLIDTFKAQQPPSKRDTVLDTIYIENNSENGLKLPITQSHYSEKDRYDIWVSGFNPSLDSVNIYNQTKFVTITNNNIKEVYPKTTALYFNLGTMYIGDKFAPKLGAGFKFKNDMIINANVGLYEKKVFYELGFNFKLYGK